MQPTFEGFKEFVRSKGNERYDYMSGSNCAFAQYLKNLGYEDPCVGGEMFLYSRDTSKVIYFEDLEPRLGEGNQDFATIICGQHFPGQSDRERNTFSALLVRLETIK